MRKEKFPAHISDFLCCRGTTRLDNDAAEDWPMPRMYTHVSAGVIVIITT